MKGVKIQEVLSMKEATSSASGLGAKTFVPHIRYNNFYSHKMYFSMKTYFFSSFGYDGIKEDYGNQQILFLL